MKHIIVKKVFCKYDCNFMMPAIKDFVGTQKDCIVALPSCCPGQLHMHVCCWLLEMGTTTGGRIHWQTEAEQIPICINPHTMQEKLTELTELFTHCMCKTMHLNTAFTKNYKMNGMVTGIFRQRIGTISF